MPPKKQKTRPSILVSACLLGEAVRYDGGAVKVESPILDAWLLSGKIVEFCPEVEGGCPIPRPPAEIVSGDGRTVLKGDARVLETHGRDATDEYLAGAQKALRLAQRMGIKIAILKEDSPSCGSHRIYDGSFSIKLKSGMGVTAALLQRHGIRVFSEVQIEQAFDILQSTEAI